MMHALRKHSSILAKMKIFLPLVVWIILLFRTANSQLSASRKHVGIFGLKHEVFFLNLEDGYFGCQVNESTDYLQLYELSKLCDGTSDCYMGSDELRNKLKCTNDCDKDGTACSNGVCLDGQCHCNDGFGGCNCQVPDENECKYRPCDVFAHCTNTLGSFTCTCFPGYQGDGLHCEDIDECQDPNIAQRCVENAECCNLPAHFVCKCKPGFEGDGEERCTDINECVDPQACGLNAECVNLPGNYTCQCREGFYGDPYNGCVDVDECVQPGVCGPGAICTNLEGGYRCDCPQGFDGDARSAQGCLDYDECARSPCGRNALCRNEVGSFRCECQQGFSGDPMTDCQAACSETDECNQDEVCSNGQCINPCHEPNACGMNAECLMGAHTKQCSCPAGFTGDPALECVRVPISCASSADCVDGSVCKESMCLPRCRNDQECALNEKCLQGSCMLTCRLDNDCFLGHICLSGRCVYGCHADSDCSASETCRDNRCVNPCSDSPCGPNAACTVVNHRASCSCFTGMVPSPTAKVGCVRAPALQCTENRDCADGTSCIDRLCRPVCANDQGCLNNERCDGGSCRPICRKDDDCRTGEICQGQTCMIGCRSDGGCADQLACIGQQCVDPCQEPTACGTNAECVVVNHRKQCSCPGGLVGDPFALGCRPETRLCQLRTDCPKGQACYSGTCMQTCRNDQNCLADERCVRGTCRTVCNSDASCGSGLICEGRICQAGCRSDTQCSNEQACINKKCTDPCATLGQCGSCSECKVIDHGVQCSCPNGYLGNPLLACSPPVEKCHAQCTCDEDGMYCVKACRQQKDCGCGQTCSRGKCRAKCNPGNCPAGLLCQNGACVAGCRTNVDCPSERTCTNGKCVDPCAGGKACGKNALCQVSDHRSLCLCPDGFQGDPAVGCVQYECQTNDDCELDKKCANGKCTNPCLIPGACGLNAQCRVVNRQAQCSCTPGFFGNARQECQPVQKNSCAQNPCGENTVCREDEQGFECSCQPGCVGDPRQGCLCEGKLKKDDCEQYACGTNAVCRMTQWGAPSCVCLPTHPHGDPYMSCTKEDTDTDCRTVGCVEGECVRDGAKFICRKDESCANDLQCANDKACIGGKCSDPCSLRGACGDNALCQTVLHRPRCSCPSCYIGRPNVECKPDPKCEAVRTTTPRPNDPKIVTVACETDGDCHERLRCDASGQCSDPCTVPTPFACDPNKKCVSRRHRPSCVCAHGFIVNDSGELVCAPEKRECFGDDGCASNLACLEGRCVNPCFATGTRAAPCPDDKACVVMDHRPTCVCMKDCSPSLSICLRDSGCPDGLACRNYQCVNPCETTTCADDTPCYVEDHKPICKFCPPGFVKDARHGCLKELGCRHSNECPLERSCINGVCVDPCRSGNPCDAGEECEVQNHETVCVKLCQCEKAADCGAGLHCDGCNCVPKSDDRTTGCEHCPPGIPCDPITGGCVKVQCTTNNECSLTEACVGNVCQRPCDLKNPCAANAVCINTNHGTDCSCIDGYHGNGFVQCLPVNTPGSVCQYNEDCPPDKLCDRLNRVCINPCQSDSCGDNADCYAVNHGIDCRCRAGYTGNAYIECEQHHGCLSDRQCGDNEACISGRCASPCQCGPNAMCDVKRHKAVCRCPPGYGGDARTGCSPPTNPCDPNPCGVNAMCEIDNGSPVCFCPRGLTGNPFKNCIPEGDECTPNPCGPNSGCRKINGKATCFCLPEFEGNPPQTPCTLPQNPCIPSPCGPNTQCTILSNGYAKCTCVPGYIESPNTIRGCVEPSTPCDPNPCGFGAVCDASRNPVCYCPESMIGNPYKSCFEPVMTPELCQPGPCGTNADCYVAEGREQCYCKPGYIGDPYGGCVEQPRSVCEPNPCGPGAECLLLPDGSPGCRCPAGLSGDPTTTGCHAFECLTDDQCAEDRACIGLRCSDPCPGSCGGGAHCRVEKHHPVCFCDAGLTGNPAIQCYSLDERPKDACNPSPCGANAVCSMRNKRPVCKCLTNYQGDPRKGCKPECDINSDCTPDKSCVNHKCVSPCALGTVCGVNAECSVNYHTPMCKCPSGYTGDAFVQCVPIPEDRNMTRQPCLSDPCGPGEVCSIYGNDVALCDPCVAPDAVQNPRCRPQCVLNTDCPFNMACLQSQCQDPCPGSCGYGALCTVERHRPVCYCPENMHGNPYEQCMPRESPRETCASIPCGANTQCKQQNGVLACVCKKNYYGDPLVGCRPECVVNTDCPISKACVNSRCVDPCVDACGVNAQCKVVNHLPICYCAPTHTGDALVACTERTYQPIDSTPCDPNPCGPNSKCRTTPDGYAICSCLPGYRGVPPACQAECMINAECPQNKACINLKCADPCPGTCGVGARCEVLNHNPICSCGPNQQGDPFVICEARQNEPPPEQRNPCDPSPCGPNSICQVRSRRPVCSCQPNFIGSPPACRPECVLSSECPQDKACINEKCQNPCANACGPNADCHVVAQSAFCSCRTGFEGDAFIGCSAVPKDIPRKDVCFPNPCAENALCSEHNGAAKCTCISPYLGDPYNTGCRPECVLNSDCPSHTACVNQHCRDPCPGVCGTNAECTVANHIPVCECSRGFVGDPFRGCRRDVPQPIAPKDPCAACPSNSVCRVVAGRPTCSCAEGYRGTPPACRPECSSNEECPHDKSCINLKCKDPCPGLCGLNAQCQVINHKPFCSCLRDMIGNPFEQCYPKPAEPVHPCQPSPCGAYSECREIDDRAVCTCAVGMLGAPPNCRPECETDQDCPSNRACFNQKCRDPCVGSCGYNAQCVARNHRPECYCNDGYEGDPYSGCNQLEIRQDEIIDPCNPSPCGSNAVCQERNGAGSCTCVHNYFGDPYVNCRPECVQSSECPSTKACVNMRCVDACLGTCGPNSECRVHNHSPVCSCSPGYTGNPSQACRPYAVENPPPRHPLDPCSPSPCGPYSICRVLDNHPVCSCQISCSGVPPNCRPECLINAECPRDRTCLNQRCVDPCPGTCGINARCRVVNHNPICSCNPGFIGDPFVQCSPEPKQPLLEEEYRNPCDPSPCGVNSLCKVHNNNRAVCSCLPNYIGRPPSCRPECTVDSECPMNLACINEKCRNPCHGSCGANTDCTVVAHKPLCSCTPGYTGDPFAGCSFLLIIEDETPMPCNPSPCGANALCKERNGAGSCTCVPEYFGDPYVGCRPECVMNSDCPRTRSCINNKCQDPCPGTCGSNAECHVVNHSPSCVCIAGYVGNPFTECRPQPEIRDEPVRQPCQPSPCGPNSVCREINGHAVCTCRQDYIGAPPNCRPECVVSSECPLDKACVRTKCVDPCPGTCGFNARCQVVNHNPICSCQAGFTGDPFVRCIPEERRPVVQETPADPCSPSPCGPNSQCKAVGHTAACSCLPNYVGRAPNCRPECTSNSQCTPMKACINERCGDPCPGSCGSNALCSVQNHQPSCRCVDGYDGDPYTSCSPTIIYREPEIVDPCNPSPCGVNAECNVRNNAGSCTCVKDYFGDPYHECRPECMLSSDCPKTRACLNNKCVDPCPGMCGINAECFVMNHSPSCSCLPGYTGNPSQACREIPKQIEHTPIDPCRPSPCGPYSECRNVNDHAVCSCQSNYIGTPPACRPECTVSSDCSLDKACVRQKCVDPCPGTCGFNARCQVVNHNPICSCPSGFTGDPFERCVPEEKQVVLAEPTNPCLPSPCGPNSQCRAVGNVPACSCLPNYVGRAPNCRPECTINAECAGNLACVNERCADPCPGSCGPNAVCRVIEHSPTCSCQTGYTGDPFSGCTVIPLTPVREEPQNPCNPSPCGSNAVCKERNGAGSCTCLPDYFGDPYSGCRPECVTNSDCPRVRACVNNKCADPCPGVCGIEAECHVVNHSPSCACRPGYTGDPFTQCRPEEQPKQNEPINPCSPSPCGANSICREANGHAVCTCLAGFIGTPPNCRPECVVSSECALDKACIGQKCSDPCPGTCGQNARCQVVNHNPICSCSLGFTGDPFVRCVPVEKAPVVQDPVDPCVPSPCGPNSICRAIGSTPACSCLPNYVGRAPNCRPECMLNAECPATQACVNERCTNPCVGSCGINARCTVVKHNPICECEAGFTGDPFSVCTEITPIRDIEVVNPCNPSPCGANAVCKERNGAGSCTCMAEYFGDPYTGCRPECVQNTDCDKSKACVNNKCRDPCPGVCGLNAECVVQNHGPVCYCLEGYTGDPSSTCTLQEIVTERPKTPGCQPSPCGPNSQCREINGHPVCSCLAGYIGTPPMCRPECVVSSECSQDRSCVNKKCIDPCPGTCGTEARCQVVNHNPICSCPPGFTGDPFIQCVKKEEQKDIPPSNPCVPSPCGPNANCRAVGGQPACSCAPNYIGRPPNCRPECTRDAECSSNLACQNERCVDPCAAGCGQNAVCRVINHKPVCTCDEGFEGNPLEQCSRILPPTTERLTPCTPSPCGPNAECRERNNAGACYCLAGYEGNPYDVFSGCRRECDVNSDCSDKLACVQYKCVDPCPGACGTQAVCEIQNHVPTCICPEGMVGDPFVRCELRLAEPVTPAPPVCDKFTCGPNSICRIQNGVAVCKCQPDMVGSPPNCRPECQQNSDCEAQRACVNFKCIDPCPGACGQNANCNIINHNPICSCAPGFTGDPFTRCYKEVVPVSTTETPRALCTPSPCGPNAECKVVGNREACSCLPGYIGSPPSCRPECILSTECADNQACIRQKCTDPCPGSCGLNAKCSVSRHTPSCSCDVGFTGDPFTGCQAVIEDTPVLSPCDPSPCGANARCREQNGAGACTCIEDHFGNPYEGCRPECVLNSDCPSNRACVRNKCQDPCPGTCGQNADCQVVNHLPSCTCFPGYEGDPFRYCDIQQREPVQEYVNPCQPSPCGPNSQCREVNGQAVCSCLPTYVGSPPGCRPECVVSSECALDKACVNQKCVDPCPGTCGTNARCNVNNHSPICSCQSGFTGDPFTRCYPIPPPVQDMPIAPRNPCAPSPCGPNSQCRDINGTPSCSCLANYIGAPPNCRPECSINAECPSNQACMNEKCRDPCPGSCGINARCNVINHTPICSCEEGYTGDPFTSCRPMPPPPREPVNDDPCNPSPCGANAQCQDGICTCLPEYQGDPYRGCRPECVLNSDCARDRACIRSKCVDPCPGTCGQDALCEVINHIPMCRCPDGMAGNAFVQCRPQQTPVVTNPCSPSPCGPNSQCREINGQAVCSCLSGYIGNPPMCRPECTGNSECPLNHACVNFKCADPCPGSCGFSARCTVVNHNPICSCPSRMTGDPFTRCYEIVEKSPPLNIPADPCQPSPCGPNALCVNSNGVPSCSCQPDMLGAPPNCRPECTSHSDCSRVLACSRQKCVDPCLNACGIDANCHVSLHVANCFCPDGYEGDPFRACTRRITKPPPQAEPKDACYPSPCGTNARCRPANNGAALCECIENYFGNPYESCRPECVSNGDCQKSLACINNRCKDPCPGVCGRQAECAVVNHTPVCSCPDGMKGNAFEQCLREEVPPPPSDPCYPSPCGQNTVCRVFNGNAVCECLPEFKGSPFGRGCYPECVINSDCPRDRTCVNKKCVDPCPGVCGYRAVCHAINNSPVCSCPSNMIGDPFVECQQAPPKDPCSPSPCRSNGICRVVGDRAECQYPECIINSDCSPNRACYNQKCQDPCVGACGLNALCNVINHAPVCSCPARHVGSPFVQCTVQRDEPPQPQPECTSDGQCTNDKACINGQCQNPCTVGTGLCTQNAECRVQFHRAICACREGYTGNAQLACYEIGCRSDSDCPATEACVNRNCIDPCRHTQCGRNAVCKSDYNHNARCHCIDGYRGNPLVGCTRPECTSNDECPYHQSCQNEQCRDPCNCAPNAQCRVDNHQASCRCPPGYTGDAQFSCEKIPVRDPAQCTMDADCPSKLACFSGVCKNPCTETKPCAEHATCTVQDTLPLRTMYCVCDEGYAGDAERQCLPVSKDEPGCYSDVECAPTESCRGRVCVDVCSNFNPCAPTAECLAQSHKAICSCPLGTVGDPFQNCYKPPVVSPECVVDADCSSSMACINERCQDPCAGSNPCGGNAECRAIYHRPHCTCPIGWGGDPKTQCYKPECKVDAECPFDKACFNEKCISPCTYGATQCGRGANCVAQSHRAVCICPPGTQGNPFVSCVTGMCQYNEDCAEHEACDRLNRVCRPVCDDETCARTATCVARNHQASCECGPGMRGNPYVECARDEPEPECRMDSECRSQQACIRNRCVNPCTELTPCTSQQTCSVIDTLPLRTIICACQTDMLMDRSGSCKPIVIEECLADSDCADTDRCQRGQCVTACKIDPCGINAQCTSVGHRAQCSCAPGYVGSPHVECLPEPRVTTPKECTVDDDCAVDRACFNDRCVNPCAGDACGRGALCRVDNHKAMCNCPNGFTMDANGNCVPPAGDLPKCRSNSDCTRSETCVNEICANPCNCGQNADCFVKDHYPVCSCRPGYSGNAQSGCFKLECESDSDCTNDKQCTNGECVNPCLLQDPCAINAECYGDRHRAACRCMPGLEGNPFERCRRVECHYDGECAKTMACQREQCVDPCANSPCAQNAQCFAMNHQAQCKCPEHLPEGNPFSFCRPRAVERDECRVDGDCPSRLACIGARCLNPCDELKPCAASALCTVQDSVPVRTMVCECPPLHVPDANGECQRVIQQTPIGVCTSDSECPEQEACINRQCRDPCSCGTHATCTIKNHRAVCSCEDGYEGNPNVACRAIGCRVDSECESTKACVNGNCVNPCLDNDPCGIGAECYARANRAECRCPSGYRGNPLVQCNVVECRSNNDCPDDKQCRNSQCINPCIYENSCSPRAECRAQNHLVVCRCPVGLVGNPYVDCRPELVPECRADTDCPSHLACIDNRCVEPCNALTPCTQPAHCEVVPSSPVRTMLCTCPDGYVSSGSGTCKPVVKAGCISDSDCSSDTACINSICRNPCNCGPNAECRVKDHKPVCSCAQGYDGDPETQCIKIECRADSDCSSQATCFNRQCVPACSMETCGPQAECIGVNHRAVCECLPGYEGNPRVACKLIGCRRDTDCPLDKACLNGQCENPCETQAVCAQNEQCQVYQHRPECACPPPFENDPLQGCVLRDDRCMTDGECPSQTACIQGDCVNPCNVTEPCGVNSNCKVLDTLPVRTMICECLPGYQGNAAIQCDKMALCPTERGFVRNSNGECVCPPGYGLSEYDDCQPCREEDGLKIDEATGRCECALERGLIRDERGRCICPIEHGYRLTSRGECIRTERPECERDEDCADWRYCNLDSKTCDDPCDRKICGTNALCNATNHRAVCQCITGYTGNPDVQCNQTTNFRTDFPQPEMVVTCQADGIQVVIGLAESNFNGVLYVKGHSKDEECRRVVNLAGDGSSTPRTEIFKVHFGSCGLIHVNGNASFVLVIQKHPKLVTYKAQAYHIKCVYETGEKNVTLGFNVQMLTTAGTIANTGPPPTCAMRIVAFDGKEINSAEIGDNLRLQVEVQPATIYGGFARSCVAKTMEESVENEYIVTDEDGCATDPSIFGDWEYNADTNSLLASFNAFKFPSSDNIRFQCNIRVCFGKCQPVNCHGANAYGKRRRRREALGIDMDRTIEIVYNRTKRAAENTALATDDDSLGMEGTLREEITIQSNPILTLEKREERSFDSNNITPAAQRVEDICVSMIGLILALVITALLALVAVAVAVSCWLMAYRRRPTITGPLPHPPEFPNPLFAHHEPSEPSHHDFMG